MRNSVQFIAAMVLTCGMLAAASCSKKSDESPATNQTQTKTVNKSQIAPKIWYTEGSSFIHDLKANGVYGTKGGTWKWKNDSDTLEIVTQSGYQETYWKVYWNTDKEMECEKVGTFTKLMYKDAPW